MSFRTLQPAYDYVREPQFSPDSRRILYVAGRKDEECVVVDGAEGSFFAGVSLFSSVGSHFSFDSKRVAFTARTKTLTHVMVVDGKPGKEYDDIEFRPVIFTPDSQHTFYVAQKSRKTYVVIDDKEGPRTVQKLAFPLGTHEDPTVYTSVCPTVAEFLAKLQPNSDPAGVNPLQFFLICLAGWINRNQQNVIEYLQEEVKVLREQLGKKPRFNDDQRRRLAAKAKRVGQRGLKGIASIVTPRTLLQWHQRLIARKYDGSRRRLPGRPRTPQETRDLILMMAAGNRSWGYTRIQGALQNLGYEIGRGTIAKVLKEAGVDPAPGRQKATTWKEFLRTHWEVLAAADFFSVEVWTALGLVRYHVLFVIRLATREVHIAGIIPEPSGPWMKQLARNLTDGLDGFLNGCRHLIHRASVFSQDFRMILQAAGIESVRLPAGPQTSMPLPSGLFGASRNPAWTSCSCSERFHSTVLPQVSSFIITPNGTIKGWQTRSSTPSLIPCRPKALSSAASAWAACSATITVKQLED